MTGIPVVNVNSDCSTGSTALFLAAARQAPALVADSTTSAWAVPRSSRPTDR